MQGHAGVWPKGLARSQTEKQGIANLAGRAGNGNFNKITHEIYLL
jgi:hypothetical protein